MTPDTLCSSLQHLLRDVISAKIGICAREIELVQLSTGKPALDKKVNVAIDDRFKLKIPISDQYMTWEVMFNCSLPNCPPDFELNDIDFFYSVTLDSMEEMIPSLKQWDHRQNKALINVISELRSAYLKYQVEKLNTVDNQCAYQYSAMIDEGKLSTDHVEILVDGSTAHFLVKLDVDLPPVLPEGDHLLILAVRWGDHSRPVNLIKSPNINRLFPNLKIHRSFNYDDTLSDIVEEVTKSIKNQIKTVVTKRKNMRKEFTFELLKSLGNSCLGYDALEYNNCSFLLERKGFLCILEVSFPPTFPSNAPRYRLLSTYSTSKSGPPLSQVVPPLPYNEGWNIPMMVEQGLNALDNKIEFFMTTTKSSFKFSK